MSADNALSALFVIAGLFVVISGYLFWGILDYHVTTKFQQAMPSLKALLAIVTFIGITAAIASRG